MNKVEMELMCIRTSIEAYQKVINSDDVSDEKKKEIEEKIKDLNRVREVLLSQNDYLY